MEKAAARSSSSSSINKFLKLLPKAAAAAVSFQNPPFSPGRDKRQEHHAAKLKTTHIGKGYSGPMFPMIPPEARQKSKNPSFETQEPTSPKVSCMGQIKCKHKKKKKMTNQDRNVSLPKDFKPYPDHRHMMTTKNKKKSDETMIKPAAGSSLPNLKKKPSSIKKMFGSAKPAGRKSDATADHRPSLSERPPSLSQMKMFASSRDTFANFDWTTSQIAPEDPDHQGSDEEENEVVIPFSAPLTTAGEVRGSVALEPKKQINLWKRRTMAQPTPLQLKITSS